jgi:hypothetical protein
MESRRSKGNVLFIDACRSPSRGTRSAAFADQASRAWGSDMHRDHPNTLVCNPCKILQVALDGTAGRNGVFTEALLKVRVCQGERWCSCNILLQPSLRNSRLPSSVA